MVLTDLQGDSLVMEDCRFQNRAIEKNMHYAKVARFLSTETAFYFQFFVLFLVSVG